MTILSVNKDDIADMRIVSGEYILNELYKTLKAHIKSGGVIQIENRYINALPDIVEIIPDLPSLEDWARRNAIAINDHEELD
jgi:hypothetical protein